MTTATAPAKALLAAPQAPKPPAAETMVRIARDFGISPLRQMREIFSLRFGPGRLAAHEYVSTGAFHPDLDAEAKREFVGKMGSFHLNSKMSPADLTICRPFLRDKMLYTQLLRAVGIPTVHTQAIVHDTRGLGEIPALRTVDAVVTFLTNEASFPLFGKPVEGSGSVGSVLIEAVDAAGKMLRLGNGKDMDLHAFAQEVIEDYPEGFLFQSAIQQHPDMQNITGAAVGALRLVTLRDAEGIKPLYALWKIPSPTAMSDNYWQNGSMIAEVDNSGRVMHCVQGTGPDYTRIEKHPVSEAVFADIQIPHWNALNKTALDAHALFPEFGIVGWDIAIGQDGPIIIEANANPHHVLYQLASGRGIKNADFMPQFEAVASESQRILKSKIKLMNERHG